MIDKIQVFGGKGFVGKNYVRNTANCIVNDRNDYTVNFDCKHIVYFISTVSNYNVKTNSYIDIETNLITLMKVLEQLKNTKITFNFISSWFVYGDTNVPASEETQCNPKGFYSITKRCAEQLIISFCETFNINYRILRLANVAGKGDPKASAQKNALQFMINELKAGHNVNLYDDGNLYRDYIHNNDVADAINLVLNRAQLNQIYNISNGVPYLFKEIISYAYSLIDCPGEIISITVPKFHQTVQVHSMWLKNDKLRALGYKPKYDMHSIVEDMVRDD